MKSLPRLVLLAALAPAADAQVLPGDLLLNSYLIGQRRSGQHGQLLLLVRQWRD